MKTPILLVQALTLIAACALLVFVLNLPWPWAAIGALLAFPALAAIVRGRGFWLSGARGAALFGLLLIVSGATADLWAQLLSGERVDASLHLLALALGLLLAILHHLLQNLPPDSPDEGDSASALLEAALRGPPVAAMLCLALVLGGALLAHLYTFTGAGDGLLAAIAPKLLQRGVIPPITLSLFLWGMALLIGKWLLIARELQRAASAHGRSFFNRASRIGERSEFAAALWQQFEAFYTLPRYIGWAIPILGFIGTVLGISLAAEGLGELLASSEVDFSQSLGQALKPLGIAFDTTLVALSLSVVFALCQTLLYRWEERRLLLLAERLQRR